MATTGSNPVLTTIASRAIGRVKVPLLKKLADSWKDSFTLLINK